MIHVDTLLTEYLVENPNLLNQEMLGGEKIIFVNYLKMDYDTKYLCLLMRYDGIKYLSIKNKYDGLFHFHDISNPKCSVYLEHIHTNDDFIKYLRALKLKKIFNEEI